MKKLLSLLILFFIFGCQNKKESQLEDLSPAKTDSSSNSKNQEKANDLSFKKYPKNGILLKGEIKLFDKNLNNTGKLAIDEISEIQILEKSTAIYNIDESEDYCLKSNFLKIKYNNQNYLVFGTDVYEINESEKFDFSNSKNEKFSIFSITNFKMGASDDNGLTGCSDFSILLILNQNSNIYSTIDTPEGNLNNLNQKFAALVHDDGSAEEVYHTEVVNDTLILGIKISYQENYGSYLLKTNINDNFRKSIITNRNRFEDENTFKNLR